MSSVSGRWSYTNPQVQPPRDNSNVFPRSNDSATGESDCLMRDRCFSASIKGWRQVKRKLRGAALRLEVAEACESARIIEASYV